MTDQRGNVIPGATIRVLLEETQEPADIYQDDEGTRPWPGGVVTADRFGFVYFCAPEGLYRIKSDQDGIDWRKVALVAPRKDIVSQGDLDNLRGELTDEMSGLQREVANEITGLRADLIGKVTDLSEGLFIKADPFSPAFISVGGNTISVKAGTKVAVNGKLITFEQDTAQSSNPLSYVEAGQDFTVWVRDDGTVSLSREYSKPPKPEGVWRMIGGFHFAIGSCAEGGGSSGGGTNTASINPHSIWDLKFRPACPDPRGMTLVANSFWSDIYLLGVDHHVNGTSKYNVLIATGSTPPKVALAFGGNGSKVYAQFNWWAANEVLFSHGKRCPTHAEFAALAYGTTENQNAGGSDVDNYTGVDPGGWTYRWFRFTSRWGVIQSTGLKYVFGADIFGVDKNLPWENTTEGRGGAKPTPVFGAYGGVVSGQAGSRCSAWSNLVSVANVAQLGARGVCSHLVIT